MGSAHPVPGDIAKIKRGYVSVTDELGLEHFPWDSYIVISSWAAQDDEAVWHWKALVLNSSGEMGEVDWLYFIVEPL